MFIIQCVSCLISVIEQHSKHCHKQLCGRLNRILWAVALLYEETTNQTESQQIKSNVGFSLEGKTRVPGEKLLRTE